MATVLKTVIGASQSRVQIPAPPPFAASLAGWLALIALAAAPFRFAAARARYSRALGVAMIGLLVIAVVLVPTGFSAWGLWERAFLFIAMASIMVMSRFLADEAMRAPAAIVSRSVS